VEHRATFKRQMIARMGKVVYENLGACERLSLYIGNKDETDTLGQLVFVSVYAVSCLAVAGYCT
jgi:hypothetical protein